MFVFAHLSDTHLDGGRRALDRTRRVGAYLRGLPLDAILVTGDIADHGDPGEYEQAREALAVDVPVLVLPGNHDDRAAFRKVLLAQGGDSAPVNQVRKIGPVTFALCDSTVPGRADGQLAPETMEWLSGALTGTTGPTFVCLHHPPVRLHAPLIDEIRLVGAADLAELIRRHPQVVAVLCGHAHTAAASTFAGRPLLVAPAVVSTLRLPWTTTDSLDWDNTLDFASPPAVSFHVLDDHGELATHYRVS